MLGHALEGGAAVMGMVMVGICWVGNRWWCTEGDRHDGQTVAVGRVLESCLQQNEKESTMGLPPEAAATVRDDSAKKERVRATMVIGREVERE